MAMHNSDELGDVASVLFEQISSLTTTPDRFNIAIANDEDKSLNLWITDQEGHRISQQFTAKTSSSPVVAELFQGWQKQDDYTMIDITGENLHKWIQYMGSELGMPFKKGSVKDHRFVSGVHFSHGFIGVTTHKKPGSETISLLERFSKVFQQTYVRFLDLQKAEAQAREAQIEAALEKVRSRTLAMLRSDELADASIVIFEQLINLGISPNRLFIGIINKENKSIEAWATNEDGTKIGSHFTLDTGRNDSVKKMYEGWEQKLPSVTIDMEGTELQNYFHYLANEMKIPFKEGLTQKRRVQTIAYFGQGLIGMASPDEQPASTTELLERFAAVFNLTYTRFNDLKIAEAHALKAEQDLVEIKEARMNAENALANLQATQKQLVQSEKMASLGELTAGIAHEIQNPLNFVNNFSEVSNELIQEIKEELENGNMDDVKEIINDIIQNLEKINHHGKRAEGIVKGMLQHSRKSEGKKEPTDINALCDEYLRLSYHGLRAKDKSFNASFETDFDETIEKIKIAPQDIGRVILNLINNAFYAVSEKKKLLGDSYQPLVSIKTRKLNDKIEILVSDNGGGIPDAIKEKIFQPFFTTKPTGSGTGLGLSLAYDIVKAHGGELKVDTKEAQDFPAEASAQAGSTFIIQLPA
ncbi:MAG: GHKL domain-containing protein [Chitinophagaceae bacterium]|nr:GHKL domain-containing protein [Chitinophagaceae bacterium]